MDSLKQMLDDLKGKRVKHYTLLTYPLDTARANESIFIAGSYIYVLTLDGTAKIKLNEISGDDIDLFKYRQIISPFYRLFLTHTPQATKVLTLAIGVSSEVFNIQDFQSPDMAAMASDISDLKKSLAYNYGTQISKSNIAIGTTVLIHTVTAGKTLLLEAWTLCVAIGVAASGNLFVTDASDTIQYTVVSLGNAIGNEEISCHCLLSIPEGHKIKVSSGSGSLTANAWIKGREI